MKIILDRSYQYKSRFYEYTSIGAQGGTYIGYAKQRSSYSRPLYLVKYEGKEVCRLEDDNLLRPWLGILSLIFPCFNPEFKLKIQGVNKEYTISSNGVYYSIGIGKEFYEIRGHSGCIVTIWENDKQVGLLKRIGLGSKNGFETIEVLYEKHISEPLIILFSVFGWEMSVGIINGNRTLTTISFDKKAFDINWQPND